ncbi:MAG: hypothetical protein LBH45_03540 [Campylobacteraceae bacterium]|jgi:hypothetical protein|nr:hypothetical protein [Campylobacteraceae bacterium]
MIASKTKFTALYLFKFKFFSFLTVFFLGFLLIGCGGGSSDNGVGQTTQYTIKFYDENLDFLYAISAPEGVNTLSGTWYRANDDLPLTNLDLTNDIRLYAVQNVQEITTQEELAAINDDTTTLSGRYILLNDIELDETKEGFDAYYGWLPIGWYPEFTGIFNGNNYKITNLWINKSSYRYLGFFGQINGGQIRNLGVEIADGRELRGGECIGGIAGDVKYSNITNSYSTGNIRGDNHYVGGIAGEIYSSSVINSYSTGNIINGNGAIGGIVGMSVSSFIVNSYSTGDVNGNYLVGGVVGQLINSSVSNSYSTGNINGNDKVGGIVGGVSDDSSPSSTIQNNAAINPQVNGTTEVNRVVGHIGLGIAENNFAFNMMSVIGTPGGNAGTDKTADEFKEQSTYSNAVSGDGDGGLGWKFGDDNDNPWKWHADKNNGLPYFYWQEL